jgi:hypothetical protein
MTTTADVQKVKGLLDRAEIDEAERLEFIDAIQSYLSGETDDFDYPLLPEKHKAWAKTFAVVWASIRDRRARLTRGQYKELKRRAEAQKLAQQEAEAAAAQAQAEAEAPQTPADEEPTAGDAVSEGGGSAAVNADVEGAESGEGNADELESGSGEVSGGDAVAGDGALAGDDAAATADAALSGGEPASGDAPLSSDELASGSAAGSSEELLGVSDGAPPAEPTDDATLPADQAPPGDADVGDGADKSDSSGSEPDAVVLEPKSDSLTSDSGFLLVNLNSDQLRALEESDAVVVVKRK